MPSPAKQLENIRARQRRERKDAKRRTAQLTGGIAGLGAVAAAAWATNEMPATAEVMGIPSQAIAGGVLMLMGVAGGGTESDMVFSVGTALAAVGVHEMTKARLGPAGGG